MYTFTYMGSEDSRPEYLQCPAAPLISFFEGRFLFVSIKNFQLW